MDAKRCDISREYYPIEEDKDRKYVLCTINSEGSLKALDLSSRIYNQILDIIENKPKQRFRARYKRWTEEEDNFFRDNINVMSTLKLAKHFGRSIMAIRVRSSVLDLNIKKNIRCDSWTEDDDKFIKDNLGNIPRREIAAKLNRSIGSVNVRVIFLGLSTPHKYKILLGEKKGNYGKNKG